MRPPRVNGYMGHGIGVGGLAIVLMATVTCGTRADSAPHPSFRADLHSHLRRLQFPGSASSCACRRTLLYSGNYYEGFACAVHQLGLAQLAALATDRMLVVPDKDIWGYVSAKSCKQRNWNCLFEPLGSCSEAEALQCNGKRVAVTDVHQDFSILAGPSATVAFRPRGPSSKHGSIHKELFSANGGLSRWVEAAGGAFQLRSAIQLWLWKLRPGLERLAQSQRADLERLSRGLGKHYVAVHVRASDNLANTERDFGIPSEAYSVPHVLGGIRHLAAHFRQRLHPGWSGDVPVFLATDSSAVIQELAQWEKDTGAAEGIRFVFDRAATSRASGKDQLLHRRNRKDSVPASKVQHLTQDVIATISLLAGADALLGSQISNVYRLASELHCAQRGYGECLDHPATEGKNSSAARAGRVLSMDVAWYQDP